jgi:uncharacterized membrane protein
LYNIFINNLKIKMKNKKGSAKVIALVAIILVLSAAVIGWFYSRQIEEKVQDGIIVQ